MYKLKFITLPKVIKKHLKANRAWQKYYPLNEANLVFNHAVLETKATGNVKVAIICPTGEPEYEFSLTIDPNLAISELILKDFQDFLNTKQAEIETLYQDADKNKEKIKVLEDDILILTNREKEMREAFDNLEKVDDVPDELEEKQEPEVMDAIYEEFVGTIPDENGLFDDVVEIDDEPEEAIDPVHKQKHEQSVSDSKNISLKKKLEANANENKMQVYLDITSIEAIQALENQIKGIDGQIKNGIDNYIFEELYLNSATDFASTEKKKLIKTKHLSQAEQAFVSMRDWTKKSLKEIKDFAWNQLNQMYDELNAVKATTRKQRVMEVAELVKLSFDKKKGELKKEIIAKRDAELIEMEAKMEAEKDQKLAVEIQKIDKALANGFNANHEQLLKEHRAEIEKVTEEKAAIVFETINQGYGGLLSEIKTNLSEHEKTIETRYQIYKEEQKDEFEKEISNRELQLRVREIEIQEKKLAQANETRGLSDQVEKLKITLEKNRLDDQMQLMLRDREEQVKEMRKFKRLIGLSFVVTMLAMLGVVAFLN